jgi:hypothetical protein
MLVVTMLLFAALAAVFPHSATAGASKAGGPGYQLRSGEAIARREGPTVLRLWIATRRCGECNIRTASPRALRICKHPKLEG